jgi:hypothetical protein
MHHLLFLASLVSSLGLKQVLLVALPDHCQASFSLPSASPLCTWTLQKSSSEVGYSCPLVLLPQLQQEALEVQFFFDHNATSFGSLSALVFAVYLLPKALIIWRPRSFRCFAPPLLRRLFVLIIAKIHFRSKLLILRNKQYFRTRLLCLKIDVFEARNPQTHALLPGRPGIIF